MNSSGRFVTLLTCASLVLVAGFLLALSTPVFAQGDNLVTLCFRGRTIKVPSYLVNRYTGAGATIGPCPTIPGASAPVFSTQPQSQTVYVGDSVTFSAVADGNPLPTYQWRLNGQNIAGATNAGYTIANVQLQHAGNYTAVASNNQKSVPSTAATLTVLTTSVSGSVLFENTLENGWENWSWAAVDFNTPVPARGTRSIRVEAQPYQALYFHHGAMDVSAYGSFSFWLHLGTTSFSPGNVVVQVVLNNNIEGPVVALTSQDFPSDTTAWKQVVVPLSSLGIPVGSPVTGFYIRNYSNQALPAFYVDDVTLLPPSPITSSFSLSPVTSDNGLPAHSVQWRDANGKQRSAVMVNQRPAGAGYLRQLTYQVAGVNRICRGTGADGHQGDGYVQNHTGYGGDSSSHNTPGTTIVRLAGPHHAIIAYDMPGYTISGKAVPTRVEWFFADGRPHPVFALSQDARALTGNLGADSRSPYGDVDYTGRAGAPAGGASFGDTYKFATLASNPEQLTSASPWRYNQPNTIPYAMQWCDPAQADAEMGHVATLPIGVRDQGSDPRLYQAEDIRGSEDLDGPIIHNESWAYQILNYVMPPSGPTWSRRLAWGTNWGLPGGFDNYGNTTLNPLQYSQHATSRNGSYNGTRAGGMVMTYSVFAVLGTHAGGYVDGTVGQTVKQMEAAATDRLVGAVGTVAASGPAGVGNAAAVTIPYTPAGYNPTFSTWDIRAAGNTVDATLSPAAAVCRKWMKPLL